jgi:hypothetical protein
MNESSYFFYLNYKYILSRERTCERLAKGEAILELNIERVRVNG